MQTTTDEEEEWKAAAASYDGGKGLPLRECDPDGEDMGFVYDALNVQDFGARKRLQAYVRRLRENTHVFKPSSSSTSGDDENTIIQQRSKVIYNQWSLPLASLPRSDTELQTTINDRLPTFLPSALSLIGSDLPATDVISSVNTSAAVTPELETVRGVILSLMYHGNTEDCTHSAAEILILNVITILCRYRGCHIQRNRNGVDSSGATLADLRPDVLIWLPSGVLAFKGEDKAFDKNIMDARNDLTKKMAHFSDAYFGEIPYQLAYACAGSKMEFWAMMRTADPRRPRSVQLTQQIDLSTIHGRSLCVRYAANIARVLLCLHETYPRGTAVRLGSTIRTATSSIFIEGTHVIKKTNRYTGQPVEDLYSAISASQGVPHLIQPVERPIVSRKGELTVKLQPVGFCPDAPCSVEEGQAARRAILTAIRWLHGHGFVHRDIRPSNIMRSEGQWFLIDLEWANVVDKSLGDYRPALLPPECVGADCTWSCASDMWQFGKLLQSWGNLDAHGHAIVRLLLEDNPNDRLGAEACVDHEFFRV